jgi:3-oxoacyl-[acyl-carrier-protein] synthase-1
MNETLNSPKAYIADIGMITSIGADAPCTAAAVNAEISGYQLSSFFNKQGTPMTLATVPTDVFSSVEIETDTGAYYSAQYDHIIKMAVVALSDALRTATEKQFIKHPVPLILALPEEREQKNYIPIDLLTHNLLNQEYLPLKQEWVRCLATGRAAGIQGLELALNTLYQQGHDYVLIGGSDSYWDGARLHALDKDERVLASNRIDGFAPGEGAAFLLLTRHPEQALSHNNAIIALSPPGISEEPGHIYASPDKIYRGDGLDQAFKGALKDHSSADIQRTYSSMNGEHYWAKEFGVALLRNQSHFKDPTTIVHPADCYGDLGAAAGPALIGLAAIHLLKQPGIASHLVYSASDGPFRAAVRVEKIITT